MVFISVSTGHNLVAASLSFDDDTVCSVTVNVWAWLSTAMSASVVNISWINFLSSFFSLFINGCDYILYGTFASIGQHDDHVFELLALSFKVVESDLLIQLVKCYFILVFCMYYMTLILFPIHITAMASLRRSKYYT